MLGRPWNVIVSYIFNILSILKTLITYRMLSYLNKPVSFLRKVVAKQIDNGPGEPLYLTQFIKNKDLTAGRKAACVTPFKGCIKSYSGFLTVNEKFNSNIFFWFFPSQRDPLKDPLIIWLNGLPTPSTYGLFLMNGPYTYDDHGLETRDLSWHKWYNVLYFDNPVGVGFSHADSPEGFPKSLTEIGENLFNALDQFLTLFSEYSSVDIYICSISFGGHYSPHFAKAIASSHWSSALKGLFLGNPTIDPISQIELADHLYELGFIEDSVRENFKSKEQSIKSKFVNGDLQACFHELYDYVLPYGENMLKKNVGINILNYLSPEPEESYRRFLNENSTRRALHVGNVPILSGESIMAGMSSFIGTTKPLYEELLQNYKLMIYTGELDLLIRASLLGQVVNSLEWEGAEKYRQTKRETILKGKRVVGFKKQYDKLNYALVLGTGHEAIHDQPEDILDLLMGFTGTKKEK